MYEIWLALNILYELGLMYLPLVVSGGLLLAVLWVAALAKGAPLCAGWRAALVVGLVVAAGAMLLVPGLTKSSLGELRYWVDWANLFAVAAGFGAVAAAAAMPVAALLRARSPAPRPGHPVDGRYAS